MPPALFPRGTDLTNLNLPMNAALGDQGGRPDSRGNKESSGLQPYTAAQRFQVDSYRHIFEEDSRHLAAMTQYIEQNFQDRPFDDQMRLSLDNYARPEYWHDAMFANANAMIAAVPVAPEFDNRTINEYRQQAQAALVEVESLQDMHILWLDRLSKAERVLLAAKAKEWDAELASSMASTLVNGNSAEKNDSVAGWLQSTTPASQRAIKHALGKLTGTLPD